MEYKDENFDFPQTGHYTDWHDNEDTTTGTIQLPEGSVNVLISYDLDNRGTILEFVANGRICCRTYDKCFSKRYVITLAKRFVKEATISRKIELQRIIKNMEDDHKKACQEVGIPYWGSDTPDVLADMILVYRNSDQEEY